MKKLLLPLLIIIIILTSILIPSNFYLTVKEYELSIGANGRIVFLSDLHGREFGSNNNRLIAKISENEPDIIVLGGDFIDESNNQEDNHRLLNLIAELKRIAPVYFALGNHDLLYLRVNGEDMIEKIEAAGAVYLEENYFDIELNGSKIRLGGYFGYAFNVSESKLKSWMKTPTYKFFSEFTNTDLPKIMVSHRPDSFIYGGANELWDIDLVLSGHTHGGLWRLPFIGGVMAPEQGIFPKYDKGMFHFPKCHMIISSGFSGYGIIPRLFNLPEITVIELK